ncbi:MAG: hypothetical protein DMF66_18235, partial [Acidobacteria bacterium]
MSDTPNSQLSTLNSQLVPPGYKQTEVGVIPEDWSVFQLGALAEMSSGTTPARKLHERYHRNGSIAWVKTMDLTNADIPDTSDVKRLEETLDSSSDLFLEPGDVLVQRSNTSDLVGTTAIFEGPGGTYAYPDLMMRLRFKALVSAQWFWRYANSSNGRRYFVSVAAGSTGSMPKISGDKLRNMPLPLPPLPEQRAIAEALSDV